jgi:hypothetical protein
MQGQHPQITADMHYTEHRQMKGKGMALLSGKAVAGDTLELGMIYVYHVITQYLPGHAPQVPRSA